MTKEEQDNIIDCLEIIVKKAGEATNDSRGLGRVTTVVLHALNELFEKEGLEPVKQLFKVGE